MAFNPEIDDRVRALVGQWPQIEAKKMFGGVGYLPRGHLVCGVYKDSLILRLGPEKDDEALQQRHVEPF